MPRLQIEGADQLRALADKLLAADTQIKSALRKELTAAAKPIVSEQRSIVKGPGGRSTGSASQQRAAYRLSRSKSQNREKAAASAQRRSGLRQTIAAATGSSTSVSTASVNLTFRMRSSQLPASQRKLGKKWQQGKGWRHPVFGDRGAWVTQVGSQYFDAPLKKAAPALAEAAQIAMQAAVDAITEE